MDRYKKMREYYEQLKPHSGIEVWNHDLAMNAATCLQDSDELLHENTPEEFYGRYEFRNGAAIALASVYGLDISMARQIMRTHQAWADYEQALEG